MWEVDHTISISFLFSVAVMVFTWFRTRSQKSEDHERRILSLEQKIEGMPGKEDIHQVQLLLAEMRGELKAIRTSMDGLSDGQSRIEKQVSLHESYLREGSH